MRRRQCIRDLGSQLKGLLNAQSPPLESRRQSYALDQFHDQVIRADVMQGADIGVVQGRDSARLFFEAAGPFFQDLDRDRSAQASVGGAKYLPHAAFPEQRSDLVGAKV